MINKNQIVEFEKLGFELVESFHKGIYGWQNFSHSCFTLSIGYDKCYYECSIRGKREDKLRGSLIDVIRKLKGDENYLQEFLKSVSRPNRFSPRNVLIILSKDFSLLHEYYYSAQ